jgi:hypothetical protein
MRYPRSDRTSDFGLRTSDFGFRISDFGFLNTPFGYIRRRGPGTLCPIFIRFETNSYRDCLTGKIDKIISNTIIMSNTREISIFYLTRPPGFGQNARVCKRVSNPCLDKEVLPNLTPEFNHEIKLVFRLRLPCAPGMTGIWFSMRLYTRKASKNDENPYPFPPRGEPARLL